MKSCVVDTNVAIAANQWDKSEGDTHADPECQQACVKALNDVCCDQVIVLDDGDRIFEEYRGYLNLAGSPGAGDKFFKHIFDHQWGGERVRRVPITPCSDHRRGFEELPVNDLDPSDRKFLATAVVGEADILNATDSDWGQQEELTKGLGVDVRQICPQHASKPLKPG